MAEDMTFTIDDWAKEITDYVEAQHPPGEGWYTTRELMQSLRLINRHEVYNIMEILCQKGLAERWQNPRTRVLYYRKVTNVP